MFYSHSPSLGHRARSRDPPLPTPRPQSPQQFLKVITQFFYILPGLILYSFPFSVSQSSVEGVPLFTPRALISNKGLQLSFNFQNSVQSDFLVVLLLYVTVQKSCSPIFIPSPDTHLWRSFQNSTWAGSLVITLSLRHRAQCPMF